MTDQKLPPHDISAEEGVIGSLLINGGAIDLLDLEKADFYHEPDLLCFEACANLRARGTAIDQITVAQELDSMGKLDEAGGVAYLSHLISVVPTALDVVHYAEIVRRLSVKRRLILTGADIAALGHNGNVQYVEDLEKADRMVLELRRKYARSDIITPGDRAEMLTDRYTKLHNMDSKLALSTGFADLDRILGGGFFDGELVVLGGDTGLGKSTVAQQLAITHSKEGNVLFCSGEMTVESLSDREVASILGRNVVEIRYGRYEDEVYGDIMGKALPVISETPVYFYRGAPLTCDGIRSAAASVQARHGNLRSVVVDYLQKIKTPQYESRYIQLGEITNRLSELAKELELCVLLVVQLKNKEIEYRENKRPHSGDIYESGRIEQDADVIMLLYRVDKYFDRDDWEAEFPKDKASGKNTHGWCHVYVDGEYPEGVAEVIVTKRRQGGGRPARVKVVWDKEHQIYRDLYEEEGYGT